jgi:hypothetical protein
VKPRRAADEPLGDVLGQRELSAEHLADRADEALGGGALADVPLRPGADGALGEERLLAHRQDEDGEVATERADLADEVDPVAVPERDVGDDEVRPLRLDELHRFRGRRGLAADHEVGLVRHHVDDPAPDERVILDDQDARLLGDGFNGAFRRAIGHMNFSLGAASERTTSVLTRT